VVAQSIRNLDQGISALQRFENHFGTIWWLGQMAKAWDRAICGLPKQKNYISSFL
jgi:hypothetical protein